jgi:hypothetical protein
MFPPYRLYRVQWVSHESGVFGLFRVDNKIIIDKHRSEGVGHLSSGFISIHTSSTGTHARHHNPIKLHPRPGSFSDE